MFPTTVVRIASWLRYFPSLPGRAVCEDSSQAVVKQGGFFTSMLQCEALFVGLQGSQPCAIKISAGGINALNGLPQDAESMLLHDLANPI